MAAADRVVAARAGVHQFRAAGADAMTRAHRHTSIPAPRERGAALILVLWLIVLLTALIGGFALAARVEALQGRVLVRGLVASNAARAGLEYSLTRVVLP